MIKAKAKRANAVNAACASASTNRYTPQGYVGRKSALPSCPCGPGVGCYGFPVQFLTRPGSEPSNDLRPRFHSPPSHPKSSQLHSIPVFCRPLTVRVFYHRTLLLYVSSKQQSAPHEKSTDDVKSSPKRVVGFVFGDAGLMSQPVNFPKLIPVWGCCRHTTHTSPTAPNVEDGTKRSTRSYVRTGDVKL